MFQSWRQTSSERSDTFTFHIFVVLQNVQRGCRPAPAKIFHLVANMLRDAGSCDDRREITKRTDAVAAKVVRIRALLSRDAVAAKAKRA